LATILTKDEMREIIGRKPLEVPRQVEVVQSKFAKDQTELDVFMEFGESAENYTEVKKIKQVFSVAEMDNQSQMFALTTTEKGIIDILKNDDKATANDIAKLLKVKVKEIEDIMTNMMDKGYLDDNLKLTPKGVETKVPDFSELYVKYKYALRFDIVGPDILPNDRTRPFCEGMIRANRLYTREEINKIGERLGTIYGIPNYDAFTRRGGWYTLPKTNIHSPSCRHIWLQTLVKKK
jgi:hypothetical protein